MLRLGLSLIIQMDVKQAAYMTWYLTFSCSLGVPLPVIRKLPIYSAIFYVVLTRYIITNVIPVSLIMKYWAYGTNNQRK